MELSKLFRLAASAAVSLTTARCGWILLLLDQEETSGCLEVETSVQASKNTLKYAVHHTLGLMLLQALFHFIECQADLLDEFFGTALILEGTLHLLRFSIVLTQRHSSSTAYAEHAELCLKSVSRLTVSVAQALQDQRASHGHQYTKCHCQDALLSK